MENDSLMSDKAWFQTRESLLSRVKDLDDQRSWKDFFDLYWKLIHNIAAKSGLARDECEEVVQDVFLDLAKRLPEFKYDARRGSFKSWLRTLVEWRVRDQFRKRAPHRSMEDYKHLEWPAPERLGSLKTLWDEEWRRNLIDAAVNRVRATTDSRLYQVFDLMVLREHPAAHVARTLKVSVTWVYLAKHRVNLLLRREIRRLKLKYERELSANQKESF